MLRIKDCRNSWSKSGRNWRTVSAQQNASARQREFLWGLLDALPERIYVKDEAGRFLLVNKAMSEAWGVPIEEFVGKTNADIHFDPLLAKCLDETDAQVLSTLMKW